MGRPHELLPHVGDLGPDRIRQDRQDDLVQIALQQVQLVAAIGLAVDRVHAQPGPLGLEHAAERVESCRGLRRHDDGLDFRIREDLLHVGVLTDTSRYFLGGVKRRVALVGGEFVPAGGGDRPGHGPSVRVIP